MAGAALFKASRVGYIKLKRMQAARMEKRMLASDWVVDGEASDENNLDGPTPKTQ